MRFLPPTQTCKSVLLCWPCFGSHVTGISWVQLPRHIEKVLPHNRRPCPLSLAMSLTLFCHVPWLLSVKTKNHNNLQHGKAASRVQQWYLYLGGSQKISNWTYGPLNCCDMEGDWCLILSIQLCTCGWWGYGPYRRPSYCHFPNGIILNWIPEYLSLYTQISAALSLRHTSFYLQQMDTVNKKFTTFQDAKNKWHGGPDPH